MRISLSIPYLNRPVGFPKQLCCEDNDIRAWIRDKNPNLLQRTNYGTYTGVGALILGAVLGLFGLKNDSSSTKWSGAAISLAGIVAGLVGILSGVKAEETPPYQQHKDKSVYELIALLDDEQNRSVVMDLLGKKKDTKAFEPLVKFITNENAAIRNDAINALAQINDPRTFGTFVKLLADDSFDVKADGVFGLGLLKDKRAIDLILPLWNTEQVDHRDLKKDILDALVRIDKEQATSFILGLITKNDTSSADYALAITTLAPIPTEAAIEPFVNEILSGSNVEKRRQAALGLSMLKGRGLGNKIFEVLDRSSRDAVIQALQSIKNKDKGGLYFIDEALQRYQAMCSV